MTTVTISGLPQSAAPLHDSYYLAVDTGSYTGHIQATDIATYISSKTLSSINAASGTITNALQVGSLNTTGAISAQSMTTTSDVIIGGNLVVYGGESLSGVGTFGSDLNVSGNVYSSGSVTGGVIGSTNSQGNLTIGNISVSGAATIGNIYATIRAPNQPYITTLGNITEYSANIITTLAVGGVTTVSGNIVPSSNVAVNIGNGSGGWFNNIYGTAVHALYADLAEFYESDSEYPAGTVLIFGNSTEVTVSQNANDRRVAGVVSTNPAYLMNEGNGGIPVALQGRVPCQVTGVVKRGDLMVTSDIPGVAMTNNNPEIGTVIGKAVGNFSGTGVGIVEVVVGRV